jgi:hypothetical protein
VRPWMLTWRPGSSLELAWEPSRPDHVAVLRKSECRARDGIEGIACDQHFTLFLEKDALSNGRFFAGRVLPSHFEECVVHALRTGCQELADRLSQECLCADVHPG